MSIVINFIQSIIGPDTSCVFIYIKFNMYYLLPYTDCESIIDIEPAHNKARTRKLRILESLNRHSEALVEVCALQLKFMQDNRDKLRLGIPVTPPVPQSKIEELMGLILPAEIEKTLAESMAKHKDEDRPLPSCHTILQLLQSFAGYNSWMAQAAKDGGLDTLTSKLDAAATDVEKVETLLKRGRRYAYHKKFEDCKNDFETAYKMLEKNDDLKDLLEDDTYARVLEWTGMCRHLRYDLEGAIKCYEACSDADPTNVSVDTFIYSRCFVSQRVSTLIIKIYDGHALN